MQLTIANKLKQLALTVSLLAINMPWIYYDGYDYGAWSQPSLYQNNALIVEDYLDNEGYSLNAICAILGNLYVESAVNPHQKEIVQGTWDFEINGYGLGGWTPGSKIRDYVEPLGLDYRDGDAQLFYLIDNSDHWGDSYDPHAPSIEPPVSWEGFKTSGADLNTLTSYWMFYWEKADYNPAKNKLWQRQEYAAYFYEFLTGETPPTPPPVPPVGSTRIGQNYLTRQAFIRR